MNQQHQQRNRSTKAQRIEDPSPLGINPNTAFSKEIPVFSHNTTKSLTKLFDDYDTDDNDIRIGNTERKASSAIEILKKSQAVLVEVEPWFVTQHMGTNEYDRWEPFFVAFPECARDRQMKFSNLAPLSEVSYRISQRDAALQRIADDEKPVIVMDDPETVGKHLLNAKKEEHKAFTRYELECCHTGDDDDPSQRGVWVDMTPVKTIHTCLSPWHEHLIVGKNGDTGELYCGRGAQFDDHVDIAIDLDRRTGNYDTDERKVAVYNDKEQKDAMERLSFDETHRQYLGAKARWEVDMSSVDTVITELLDHSGVEFVSVNRILEKEFMLNYNPAFRNEINGYPGFGD